jgi:hypothetical protein
MNNNQPELEIDEDGNKFWRLKGMFHREDGPAIEWAYGYKGEWWIDGRRHRLNGPAIERVDGYRTWFLNGKLHRVDGPAVIYPNGEKRWYINGIDYTYEEWFQKLTSEQQENYLWNLDE